MPKTQDQYNSEYSELCKQLGHALSQKRQAYEDMERLQNQISTLRAELNKQIEEEKVAQEQAELAKAAAAAKDVTPVA